MGMHRVLGNPIRRCTLCVIAAACMMFIAMPGHAQSLDELIDEQQYLDGLSELNLPEVLNHYVASHPTNDPARQTYFQIAHQRMAMRRPDATPARRTQLLQNIIDLRQALIDLHPDDPRRTIWLSDQAAAWMFEMFNVEAAGWTSVFGSPMPQQRQRAAEAASKAYELANLAKEALAATLLQIESQHGFVDDVAAQLQRQRFIERERRRRLPLVGGISAVVHTELSVTDPAKGKRLYEEAIDQLQEAVELTDGLAACHGRVYLALAFTRLDQFAEAHAVLEAVESGSQCNADLQTIGGLVGVELAGARDGPAGALQEIGDMLRKRSGTMSMLQRVLLTDQQFLWRRAATAELEGEQREAQLALAYQAYLDLLDMNLDEPAEVVRSIVVSRIANVVDDSTPIAQLPPLVAVALAESQARDPASRSKAIVLLQSVLERTDIEAVDRAAALFSLGRTLYEDQRSLDAARSFLELAREYPTDGQAERSAELAATLAFTLFERQKSVTDVRNVLNEAVTLIREQYPNVRGIDRWRYVAGELAIHEQRYDDAMAHFKSIGSTAEQYHDALFMQGNVSRLAAEAESDQLKKLTLNEQAVETVRNVREPIQRVIATDGVSESRLAALQYYVVYLNIFEAKSLLELTDAQRALDLLLQVELDSIDEPEARADVLLARITAYQALGRAGEAQDEVGKYLDAAPDQVSQVLPPMMLEIEREVRELLEFGLKDEATARAHRELLPMANLLSQWLVSNPQWRGDEFRLRRRMSAAYELSGEFAAALTEYERLLVQHPNLLALLLGKAECLYRLGSESQLAEAIQLYKRIGASERDHNSPTYWQSQLRMLQILDAVGQNTEQIAPRIKQLEQRDPAFGGTRWQAEFYALRRTYR